MLHLCEACIVLLLLSFPCMPSRFCSGTCSFYIFAICAAIGTLKTCWTDTRPFLLFTPRTLPWDAWQFESAIIQRGFLMP